MKSCNTIKIRCLYTATAFLFAFLLFFPASSFSESSDDADRIVYKPVISGVEDRELREILESISSTFSLVKHPPLTENLLRKRIENDIPEFEKALRSKGYFDPGISYKIKKDVTPVIVDIGIELGPPYLFDTVKISQNENRPEKTLKLPSQKDLGLDSGKKYSAGAVLDAQKLLIVEFSNHGFPFTEIKDREIIVNHATKKVDITFFVESGPLVYFGDVVINGLERLDAHYVERELKWKTGDQFNEKLVTETRGKLIQTGLFSVVNITKGELSESSKLPLIIDIKERTPRTVSAGVGYQTDSGFGAKLEWEHRNLLGKAEKLNISLAGDELKKNLSFTFQKPDFFSENQILILKTAYDDEVTDAFESSAYETSAIIERNITDIMTVGAGVRYRFSQIKDDDTDYSYFSFPLYLRLDYSDDLLDPSKGGRLYLALTPYNELFEDSNFIKFRATYRHYFEILADRKLILALKGSVGRIQGADKFSLPKDELFYAGGGGSVRGYAYQTAGDVIDGDPQGGLSIIETSTEFRYKFSRTMGVVAFLDGGRAFSDDTPDLDEEIFWGGGLGFRYYTPIGPVRFDAAIPLNPREDVDDGFQIYISIGQAF